MLNTLLRFLRQIYFLASFYSFAPLIFLAIERAIKFSKLHINCEHKSMSKKDDDKYLDKIISTPRNLSIDQYLITCTECY